MAATLFLSGTNASQIATHLKENAKHAGTLYLNLTYPGRLGNTGAGGDELDSSPANPVLRELEDSARLNQTIVKLVISGDNVDAAAVNQGHASWNQWYQSIIAALSHLTQLKELKVQLIRAVTFRAVICPSLSIFFKQARHLTTFQMDRVSLEVDAGRQVMPGWCNSVFDHSSLQEFVLKECGIGGQQEDDLEQRCILYPFLLCLASLPTLTRVSLQGLPRILPPPLVCQSAVQDMFQKAGSNLVHLEYTGLPLGQPPLANSTLARAVGGQLQTLETDFQFTKEEYTAVAAILERSTTLQSLQLRYNRFSYLYELSDNPIASRDDYAAAMIAIAKALKENHTLQIFHIGYTAAIPKAVKKAFVEALEVNYSLKEIIIHDRRIKRLEFLTKLNRKGRREILEGWKSREEWIDKLVSEREDLDCLFYYLQANPSLCGKCKGIS